MPASKAKIVMQRSNFDVLFPLTSIPKKRMRNKSYILLIAVRARYISRTIFIGKVTSTAGNSEIKNITSKTNIIIRVR